MEFLSGNIFIREMRFAKAGDVVEGHKHIFDHTTYVYRGKLRIEKLDEAGLVVQSVVKGGGEPMNWALIKAGVRHRITALEDDSIGHCVYSHRVPQALVDHQGKDPEFDSLLAELCQMAETKFGQIVQVYEGWQEATT